MVTSFLLRQVGMLPLMIVLHTVNRQVPAVVGASCSDIALDFTNNNANACASIEEFEAAFLGLYQAVNDYIEFSNESLMEGNFADTDSWINQDGTQAGGGSSNNGASYAIVQGNAGSGGRKQRRLPMVNDVATPKETTTMAVGNRHLDTAVDCPLKEECNADWCCMMCGTNCSRRHRLRALRHHRGLVTPSDICSFVESYYLEGCLESATVACTIVSY